jgi:LysR family transcriptional regulator, hydrogen peroxide-inducible genes activator
MNIHQFRYILALEELRHFEKAADKCFVTQSTLSTMISKLEDELGILIFDRRNKPVTITNEGIIIIEQLKIINKEIGSLNELVKEIKGEVKGKLTMAVIPTIAPFLLPLFLSQFAKKFPNLELEVKEQTTHEIIRQLKSRDIDVGIISIPILDNDIHEIELYHEPFVYYNTLTQSNKQLSLNQIDLSNLFLLEEGHCMRTQVLELCSLYENQAKNKLNFNYKAGSIDSLMRFVKLNDGATLLPFLASIDLENNDTKHISAFKNPVPYRSVGLVVHKHFVKNNLLKALQEEIISKVLHKLPSQFIETESKKLNPIKFKKT